MESIEKSSDDMFELAPVSLWLEDYSELRAMFEQLRSDGVEELRAHLEANPELVAEAATKIKLLRVNQRTLEMLGASSQEELEQNMSKVLSGDMYVAHINELVSLWNGETEVTTRTVNYRLSGERLDVLLNLKVLPGHEQDLARVMVAIEDITPRARAEKLLTESESYARGLFTHSPVSLWVEDWRSIKVLLDGLRANGITDFRTFIDVHPEFVERCMHEINVIDLNDQTLRLLHASSKDEVARNMDRIFRDDIHQSFAEQLIELWSGVLYQQRETVNYALNGDRVDVHMQFSMMPGHEEDWALALVSLTDISARKKAEAYLEYLGKHDTLTTLRNRSYFDDEIARLGRRGPWPVAVLTLDMNGLKFVNDQLGHAAGDSLLRRAGEVLTKAVDPSICAARIGGDEFCMLVPGTDEDGAAEMAERLRELTDLNNQYYGDPELSFAIGAAVCARGDSIEATVNIADGRMYEDKREAGNQRP
jgi:diguanylate cyclase (GGDEF)-like protein/PAS domain S-box-containing protein